MKKMFLICTALLLTGLVSCKQDPKPDPKPEKATLTLSSQSELVTIAPDGKSGDVEFEVAAGEALVTIETNQDEWTLTPSDEEWCTVIKKDNNLTIRVTENSSVEQRITTISLKAGKDDNIATATIDVKQAGLDQVTLSVGSDSELVVIDADEMTGIIDLPNEGEGVEIEVTTNQDDWTFEKGDASEWLTVTKDGDILVVSAEENLSLDDLSTSVTIIAGPEQNRATFTFTVSQEGKAPATLEFDPNVVELAATGDSHEVRVTTNQLMWDFECEEVWLTVEKMDDRLIVSAPRNNTGENLTATISVTAGEGENTKTETVSVTQPFADNRMILTLTITNVTARLPLTGNGLDCTVDWGDGTDPQKVTTAYPSHTYAEAGTYDVKISGSVPTINANNTTNFPVGQRNNIVAVKQWGQLQNLTSMQAAFYQCTKLTSIPAVTGDAFPLVSTFMHTFYQCALLASIPEDLFASATGATSFQYTFSGCKALTTIPAKLFVNNTKVTTFQQTFYQCTAIESIPTGLFDAVTEGPTLTFASVFDGCTNITAIPAGLFDKNVNATTFSSAFANTKITSIPAGLFKNNSAAYQIASTFTATPITSIPAGLFDGLLVSTTNPVNFSTTFKGCTELTSIPAGLFDKNVTAKQFSDTFNGCTNLAAIPADLFAKNEEASNFMNVFMNCTSLTSIPTGLFDNNKKVINIKAGFSGCTNVEGESPYTMVEGVKVHLYERGNYPDLFTPYTASQISATFKGCTKLSDYQYMVDNYNAWTK